MIKVNDTILPPLKALKAYLKLIWKTRQVTNNGPLVQQLENELKQYLEVEHLLLVSSGTMGLQMAIRALQLKEKLSQRLFFYRHSIQHFIGKTASPFLRILTL